MGFMNEEKANMESLLDFKDQLFQVLLTALTSLFTSLGFLAVIFVDALEEELHFKEWAESLVNMTSLSS